MSTPAEKIASGLRNTVLVLDNDDPVIRPPGRYGFGTTIVTQSLKSVSGSISSSFAPEGLHCWISFRA